MALILSRRFREGIILNDDIHIIITGINRGQVRISVEAPPAVKIFRDELYDKIHGTSKSIRNKRSLGK